MVISTNTHLVEFWQGLIVRSCRLGSCHAKYKRILLLEGGLGRAWCYVLLGTGTVCILRGRDLEIVKVFTGVKGMCYFLMQGRRLIKIRLSNLEVILTDGV